MGIAGLRPRKWKENKHPKKCAEKCAASTTDAVMSSETSVAKAIARNDADDRADDCAGGESDRRRMNRQPSPGNIPERCRQQPDACQRKLILMLRHDQTPKLTGCMGGDRHGAKPWFMPPSATPQTVYCNKPSRLSARQHDHRPVSGLASRARTSGRLAHRLPRTSAYAVLSATLRSQWLVIR